MIAVLRRLGLTLSLTAAPVLSGCTDADAQQRSEAHATLTSAASDLWLANSVPENPTDEDVTSLRQKIQQVLREVGPASGGTAEQKRVGDYVAAQANGTMGSAAAARAAVIETRHRSERTELHSMLDAVTRLDILAESLETMDTTTENAALDEQTRETRVAIRQASEVIASLDGPIAASTSANRDDLAAVSKLRGEANDLRRQAVESGPARGFVAYEQAVRLDRQADTLEFEIGRRETELQHTLVPRHEITQALLRQLERRLEAIDEARGTLAALSEVTFDEAQAARDQLAGIMDQIGTRLDGLTAEMSSLADLYDQAGDDYRQAVSKARSVARGSDDFASTARVEAAQASQALGDLMLMRARGLGDHLGLIERSNASTGDLETLRGVALEQARAAYTEARSLVDQLRGRGAPEATGRLKVNLDAVLTGLSTP